jgi:chemotaxis protein methyltransferase CheR
MLVHEFLKKNPGHPNIEITATDIADHALKRCKEARYSQLEVQRGLSTSRILQYFDKETDDSWQLKSEIRNRVIFKKLNLLDSFQAMGQFNLILCRYVLIYQESEKKKAIVRKLEDCLLNQGSLILGASESAMGLSQILKQEAIDGFIYYQKKT